MVLSHCVKSAQIRSSFWSVFSRIRTEYGEILRISPYSVRMRENTDQKKLRIWTLFTQSIHINRGVVYRKKDNLNWDWDCTAQQKMSTRRYRSRLQITERKRHDHFVVYFQEFTGKKNLLILSTHEGMLVVIKDDRKSWLYKLYDFTYLSPKNEFYMTKTKCRRWNNTAISKHN